MQRLTWVRTAFVVAPCWDIYGRQRIRCQNTLAWLEKTGRQRAGRLPGVFFQKDGFHRCCIR